MARVTRRGAIKTLGAAAAAAPVFRLKAEAAGRAPGGFRLQAEVPDSSLLAAIAEVVIPAEADRKAAVDAFIRWIRESKEVADTDHGYGNTRVRATGPSPAGNYGAQIAALESADRAANAAGFAKAPFQVRRHLLERAIADAKIERLPSRPTGGHVATDLMGHYFASSSASDLCYGVAIGRDQCRGAQGSDEAHGPIPAKAGSHGNAR